MRTGPALGIVAVVVVVAVGIGAYYFVDIDQTQQGSLPDVNVDVEGGELPEYDVETGNIELDTTQETIEVPDVDIRTTEQTIEVPTIEVEPAPAD